MKALNHFYLKHSPLWQIDFSWEGFSWISSDDSANSVIAFRRMDDQGNEIIAVCNFTKVERPDYRIGAPKRGDYRVLLNSDDIAFGGEGNGSSGIIKTEDLPMHSCEQSMVLDLPGFSVLYLELAKERKKGRRKRPLPLHRRLHPAKRQSPSHRKLNQSDQILWNLFPRIS